MLPVIAVDFGGTHLRAAFFPQGEQKPQQQVRLETRAQEGPQAVIERLMQAIEQVMPGGRAVQRIAVAAPGPLNPRTGIVLRAVNLPGWTDIPLKAMLEERFQLPAMLDNDANLAALGEWALGAGQGMDPLLYLTISTGIGGGIILDGKVFHGAHGLAGELGHMQVQPDGPLCSCGRHGHLEAIASGPAIARQAVEALQRGQASALAQIWQAKGALTAADVGQQAQRGDPLALGLFAAAGQAIGAHLASLVHAFNPARIVIGGGVSNVGQPLFEPLRRKLAAEVIHPAYLQSLEVLPAALGDDAGLVGASVLARQT